MKFIQTIRNRYVLMGVPALVILAMVVMLKPSLRQIGRLIVLNETLDKADAVVVLNTGQEYYPRLIQAAAIYRQGYVHTVVINGNRKTQTLRELESRGFNRCCRWYADALRILMMLGVPKKNVVPLSVEDAYDTISEAEEVGQKLIAMDLKKIIITTSKYHTRRAHHIWHHQFEGRLSIQMAAAEADPFDPDAWWREGRQIRWVMAEYGAWVYYLWKFFIPGEAKES